MGHFEQKTRIISNPQTVDRMIYPNPRENEFIRIAYAPVMTARIPRVSPVVPYMVRFILMDKGGRVKKLLICFSQGRSGSDPAPPSSQHQDSLVLSTAYRLLSSPVQVSGRILHLSLIYDNFFITRYIFESTPTLTG